MSNDVDVEQQSYAEIDLAVGVFRVCPRCQRAWPNEARWREDTQHAGTELRQKSYTSIDGQRLDAVIELEVRKHACGGETYSRGKLVSNRLAPE